MTVGAVVWAVIGVAWVLWLVATTVLGAVPGVPRVLQCFVGSWVGRSISIAAWGGAGWHLFCQRP